MLGVLEDMVVVPENLAVEVLEDVVVLGVL